MYWPIYYSISLSLVRVEASCQSVTTPCFDKAPSANATSCSSHKTPENSLDIQLRNEEFYKKLSEASPKA